MATNGFARMGDIMDRPGFREVLEAARQRIAAREAKGNAQPKVCPQCQGAGYEKIKDYDPTLGDWKSHLVACPCDQVGRQERIVKRSGMPESLRHMTFSGAPRDEQEPFWEACMDWCGNPSGWLWMMGDYGRGKSHLAACIGNAWVDCEQPVIFRMTNILLDEIRSTFERNGNSDTPSTSQLWDTFMNTPNLILDEFPASHETEWVVERMWTLLNHRWMESKITVVTTNLTLEQLAARQPRWATRVNDSRLCTVLDFGWAE